MFVEQPFSPPEKNSSSIAAVELTNSSDWSAGALVSNDDTRHSRSPADKIGPSPLSLSVEKSESESMFSLFKRTRDVDIFFDASQQKPGVNPAASTGSTTPGASTYSQRDREVEPKLLSGVNKPHLLKGSSHLQAGQLRTDLTVAGTRAHDTPLISSSTPPTNITLPSSSSPPSHPRAQRSFSAFPHSPKPYKSALATPHVLGGQQEMEPPLQHNRVRANSSRMQKPHPKSTGSNHQPATPSGSHISREGSTEFLEDFIDGL
jgi:hypothetical protein